MKPDLESVATDSHLQKSNFDATLGPLIFNITKLPLHVNL